MKSLVGASLLVAFSLCNSQVNGPRVELLEFGTFRKIASLDDLSDSGTISQKRHSVAKVELIKRTTEIPARIGTSFGFRVKFFGEPGEGIVCTAKCLHPKLADPSSGRSREVQQWDTSGMVGSDEYIGYTLDHDWELVPGQWTIQVFVGSRLMIEKTFTLSVAPPA